MAEMKYKVNRDGDLEVFRGIDEEKVVIPGEVDGRKVVAVRANAFKGCRKVKEVVFGPNIRSIGRNAFLNCTSLARADLGDIEFDPSSFAGCSSLEEYDISGSKYLISIEGAVYTRDKHLLIWPQGKTDESAFIAPGTRTVCKGAFTDCRHVRRIFFPQTVDSIEDGFTSGCLELEGYEMSGYHPLTVSEGMLFRKDRLISCPPALPARSVSIGPKVTSIAEGAFRDCRFIADLALGSEIKDIGENAFEGMTGLRSISVPAWFDADLPFEFLDGDMNVLDKESVPGHVFSLRDGKFVQTGKPVREAREERSPRSEGRGLFPSFQEPSKFEPVEIKDVTFDDIAGHQDVKQEIMDRIVLPVEKADLFRKFGLKAGGGVLMYGPPGTGKTMLAQAVACQLGAPLISVQSSDLLNKFVGNTEANVKALFAKARSYPRAVIFFDDFDSIGRSRGDSGNRPWADSLVVEILTQMQGVRQHDSTLLVLAATNRPWVIDSALTRPGRFDVLIHVPLPDGEAREAIFRSNLGKYPCEELDYGMLSEETEGYNAADIVSICKYAKLRVVKRSAGVDSCGSITMEDVMEAIENTPSSVSVDDLANIMAFEMTGAPAKHADPEEEAYVPDEGRKLAGYL